VDAAPMPDPNRLYVVVAQTPQAGARVHRTTVRLTLRPMPRAQPCTTAQVRTRLVIDRTIPRDDRYVPYRLLLTNTSNRMCSVEGVPHLEFWSSGGTRLPIALHSVQDSAAFDDINPAGTKPVWQRSAGTDLLFRSGSECRGSALHPTSAILTTGDVHTRLAMEVPKQGVCSTGAEVAGFDITE
jgi:hypothetical protein